MPFIILLLAYFLWNKIRAAKELQYSFGLPNTFRVANFELSFVLPMVITNPNTASLLLQSADMLFESDVGLALGRARINGNYKIMGLGKTVLPVIVTAKISALLRAYPYFQSSIRSGEITARMRGKIQGESVTINVDDELTFNIELPI